MVKKPGKKYKNKTETQLWKNPTHLGNAKKEGGQIELEEEGCNLEEIWN